MMSRFAILLLILMVGCGYAEDTFNSSVSITWQAPLSYCANSELLGDRLEVTMQVGGFSDLCELEVDPDTLTASNDECGPFRTGLDRPILISYSQRNPLQPDELVPIAYFVSYAKLCKDQLEPGQEEIDIVLVDDDNRGKFIYQQNEIDAIPSGVTDTTCNMTLQDALQWAKHKGISSIYSLDNNCYCSETNVTKANCSNLEQACADTLFPLGSGCY
ncbi:MAG: hypothetical protein JW841_05885 [Deltaproteobacteria bacterium]|nr:hypothetical protein [Deltaproteobacteria bacterium]